MKFLYFENVYRDESNTILYDIIYFYILLKKYGQSKLDQISHFLIGHLLRDGESINKQTQSMSILLFFVTINVNIQ